MIINKNKSTVTTMFGGNYMHKKYKIGDISKLLNIPMSNLRFYEDKGIVNPAKDETNGYRYYTAWDLNDLMDTLHYRGLDFSLDDISFILNEGSHSEITMSYIKQEQKILEKIETYTHILEILSNERIRIQNAKEYVNTFTICKSPGFIFHRFRNKNTVQDIKGDTSIEPAYTRLKPWLNAVPDPLPAFYIPLQSLRLDAPEEIEYWYGYSLSYENAAKNKIKATPPNEYIPSSKSIYTVFIAHEEDTFMNTFYKTVYQKIISQGNIISGSPHGRLLVKTHESGTYCRYFEVWVPILN